MMPDPEKLGRALGRLTVRAIGYALLALPMAELGAWIYHVPYWHTYAITLAALALCHMITRRYRRVTTAP